MKRTITVLATRGIVAAGIAGAVIAVVAPAAQARVPDDRTDHLAAICLFWQNQYDGAGALAGSANPVQHELGLKGQHDAAVGWNDAGCNEEFGSIVVRTADQGERAPTAGSNRTPDRPATGRPATPTGSTAHS